MSKDVLKRIEDIEEELKEVKILVLEDLKTRGKIKCVPCSLNPCLKLFVDELGDRAAELIEEYWVDKIDEKRLFEKLVKEYGFDRVCEVARKMAECDVKRLKP